MVPGYWWTAVERNWDGRTPSDRAYVYTSRDALCKRQLRVLVRKT